MNPLTLTGLFPTARCGRVARPDFTPATSNGTTRACFPSPSKATIQRIGRMKRGPDLAVQYMLFGKLRLVITPGRISGNTSRATRPDVVFVRPTYSPFGVFTRIRSSTRTWFLAAKPSAACVGLPSASNAIRTGGPETCSSRSGCFFRTSGT